MNLRASRSTLSVWLCAGLLLPALPGVGRAAQQSGADTLTLEQARAYMVELINRDRASRDLPPVRLDATATAAAQQHADEMAAYRYMAHWDRAGRLPDQRYTEAGGRDHVMENVYLAVRSVAGESADLEKLPLESAPTFTRHEIEEIEAAYFNEVPPHDGHRRNILGADHTYVGIALTRAAGGGFQTLANAQEFVDRFVALDALPASARVGDTITVSGRMLGDSRLRGIGIARGPLPTPLTRDELQKTRQYAVPSAFTTLWPDGSDAAATFRVEPDGRFSTRVRLSDDGRPGLYYVQVWVSARGHAALASQQTVVVR